MAKDGQQQTFEGMSVQHVIWKHSNDLIMLQCARSGHTEQKNCCTLNPEICCGEYHLQNWKLLFSPRVSIQKESLRSRQILWDVGDFVVSKTKKKLSFLQFKSQCLLKIWKNKIKFTTRVYELNSLISDFCLHSLSRIKTFLEKI